MFKLLQHFNSFMYDDCDISQPIGYMANALSTMGFPILMDPFTQYIAVEQRMRSWQNAALRLQLEKRTTNEVSNIRGTVLYVWICHIQKSPATI